VAKFSIDRKNKKKQEEPNQREEENSSKIAELQVQVRNQEN
jgi:hypothetical protein